ncbi:MAG: polyphosphate polymerase domain-containing protein [Candidatus Omnitrophica bacterium]|nr:polyphosphate polymerase domain-containing protein [Candidatus Omnitrophota bacterium]
MTDKFITHFQRYELKYWVTEETYSALVNDLAPFVEHDAYCADKPRHSYPIWSLYLDDESLSCYSEREDGLKYRQKYRLRTYTGDKSLNEAQNDVLFVEIKKRQNKVILKDRSLFKVSDAENILDFNSDIGWTSNLEQRQQESINQFNYYKNLLSLRPVAAIKYDREAFFGRIDKNVRITFDRNICSKKCSSFRQMYTESKDWLHLKDARIVLEIKVYNAMPSWLVQLVRIHQLKLTSISKYCSSIDTLHQLTSPNT